MKNLSLQKQTIQINGKEVSLLEASKIFHAEVTRITNLNMTDAERQRKPEELARQEFAEYS